MHRRLRTTALASALVSTSLLAACAQSQQKRNADLVNASDATRFAYGVGYTLGQDVRAGLAADGLAADEELVADGFLDAMKGQSPDMPKKELDRVLRSVHRVLLDRSAQARYAQDAEFRKTADANAARSAQAIHAFASQPGARRVEEGVYELVLASGSGPVPGEEDLYVADWSLSLSDGNVIDVKKQVAIDPDALLPRASAVLRSMRVGDHRKVAFAPEQAFGLGGDLPAIGPNEAVFVDITVTGTATPTGDTGGAR